MTPSSYTFSKWNEIEKVTVTQAEQKGSRFIINKNYKESIVIVNKAINSDTLTDTGNDLNYTDIFSCDETGFNINISAIGSLYVNTRLTMKNGAGFIKNKTLIMDMGGGFTYKSAIQASKTIACTAEEMYNAYKNGEDLIVEFSDTEFTQN